jgi:hypothetical protein
MDYMDFNPSELAAADNLLVRVRAGLHSYSPPQQDNATTPTTADHLIALATAVPGLSFDTIMTLIDTPLEPSEPLTVIEHQDMPRLLAASLPGVTHRRYRSDTLVDEHLFLDEENDAAVRIVLEFDTANGRVRTWISHTGMPELRTRLIECCHSWDAECRRIHSTGSA